MLEARYFGYSGPFDIVPSDTRTDLDFRTLPDECNTLEMSRRLMDDMIAVYTFPTVIYVGSANARYPEVEGFVVYTSGSGGTAKAKIIGFQMKTGDVKPRVRMNKYIINGGAVLLRGQALVKSPREPKEGWVYKTSMKVREFLGHLLLLAMPRDWLRDPKFLQVVSRSIR
jgi:hypothetical protein